MNFKTEPSKFRNMIFGAEDSLVSTVGVLFGIATADTSKSLIVMSGLIVVAVEALSMGAGAYLSEKSTQEVSEDYGDKTPEKDGIIMFWSYMLAGCIPLIPYILLPIGTAKFVSVIASLCALFLLGYIPTRSVKSALRMLIVAGTAVFIGFLIATVTNFYLGA